MVELLPLLLIRALTHDGGAQHPNEGAAREMSSSMKMVSSPAAGCAHARPPGTCERSVRSR